MEHQSRTHRRRKPGPVALHVKSQAPEPVAGARIYTCSRLRCRRTVATRWQQRWCDRANSARTAKLSVTPSGIEPSLGNRKTHKRHADLHSDLRALDSSRWGHLRAVETRMDP